VAARSFQVSPRNCRCVTARIEGRPEERILSYLMLRSLKQARYSEENRGHFALASGTYTHFTSPIRRYPDLVVHRVLCSQLARAHAPYAAEALKALADDCSYAERRAADAERELVEWKKVKFMSEKLGEEFRALIISTQRFGFFVELQELFVEGLVPIETLPGDRYGYHENTRKIVGERSRREFSIGDEVVVRLDRIDPVERKLQFSLAEPEPRTRRKRR
jgi:ribonuclease R